MLILTLKRFEFHASLNHNNNNMMAMMSPLQERLLQFAQRQKIDTLVDFPIDGLNLAPFCHHHHRHHHATAGTVINNNK